MMSPVSESEKAPQHEAVSKDEVLLRRYLERTIRKIESIKDAKDEFDYTFRISEAIRMTARAIERMRLNLSIKKRAPFRTVEVYEDYLVLDMGVPKIRTIKRKDGKVLNVFESWLSDRSDVHPSTKVALFKSGELTALLKQIAEELKEKESGREGRADKQARGGGGEGQSF